MEKSSKLNFKNAPSYVKFLFAIGLIGSIIGSLFATASIPQALGYIFGGLILALLLEIIPYFLLRKKIKEAHTVIFSWAYCIVGIMQLIGSIYRS
ncbi:hypothetical protein HN670_01550 [bacterium]|jgi:hypothetical protein|nr:hypothetical protein [bacterium]